MKKILCLVTTIIGIGCVCTAALATMQWYKTFNNTYKPASGTVLKSAQCGVCHVKSNSQGGLNPYGKLLEGKKISTSSLKAIENTDADKDGFSNIVEIKAGSLPGDPQSKPSGK